MKEKETLFDILLKVSELRMDIETAEKRILRLLNVSGGSLPLKIERIIAVVAQRWGKDYGGSTVGMLGKDAIELCEQYGIDWENYR